MIIAAVSLIIFKPLSFSLEKQLTAVRDGFISTAEEKYGIKIKYGSMSPAFFKRLLLRDVSIYDAENGERVAFFSLIYVDYRFFSLIKKDALSAVAAVRIYDGAIDVNTVKNRNVLDKLLRKKEPSAAVLQPEEKDGASISAVRAFEEELKNLRGKIKPANIILRNIALNYSSETFRSNFYISGAKFNLTPEKIEFNLGSNFSFHSFTQKNIPDVFTALNVSGSFYQSNASASSIINFSGIRAGEVDINKISLFASYMDKVLSVTTLQDLQPVDIKGSWNTDTGAVGLDVECKDLYPFSFANYSKDKSFFTPLKDVRMTGGCGFNFFNKDNFSWYSRFDVNVPEVSIKGVTYKKNVVRLDAEGDNAAIKVNNLSADGEGIKARLLGTYKIKEVLPDFKLNIARLRVSKEHYLSANVGIYSDLKNIYAYIPKLSAGNALIKDVKTVFGKKEKKTDFSVSGKDGAGGFNIDGSWVHPQPEQEDSGFGFLEVHGTADSLSINNLYAAVQAFSPKLKNLPKEAGKALEPVQMTSEFYVSSDFKDFSYNVIQTVLASRAANGFYGLFSANGSKSSFNISDVDVFFNKLHINGGLNAELENGGYIFNSLFTLNDITYKVSGLYADNVLSVYGDYGININIFTDDDKKLKGTIQAKELPVPLIGASFTADSSFEYAGRQNWNFNCNELRLEYADARLSAAGGNLEFSAIGHADPSGAFFREVRLGRKDSFLTGTASFNPAPNQEADAQKDLKPYKANILLTDEAGQERFELNSSVSFSDKVYFDGKADLENISLEKFFKNQKKENKISSEFVFSGSNELFSLKLDLKDLNVNLNGNNLIANSVLSVDDEHILLSDAGFSWGMHKMDKVKAELNPAEGTGRLSFDYTAASKKLHAGASLEFDFHSTAEKNESGSLVKRLSSLISSYTVNMTVDNWNLEDKKGSTPVAVSFVREPNIMAFYAGEGDKIYGVKTDDGIVSLHIDESLPVHLNLDGIFTKETVNMNLSEIYIGLPWVVNLIPNNETIRFDTGEITGNLHITGTGSDPLFEGDLMGSNIICTSPYYSPDKYGPAAVPIKLSGAMLTVPYTVVPGKTGSLWAEVSSEFVGWIPYDTVIKCGTLNGDMGLIKTKNMAFHAEGRAATELKIEISPELINLEGYVNFDKGHFSVPFNELYKIPEKYSGAGPRFTMNLKLDLGKKSEFRYPSTDFPFLRAYAYTDEPFVMTADSVPGIFEMSGSAKIRTGEVFYIKRNFYIREGNFELVNIEGQIEPIVTLRAEIRDKMASGQPVTITMRAKNQYLDLDRFNPELSSSPALSDNEIKALLGQIAIGDTNKENLLKNTLINASDIFAQFGFLRKVEDKIRDTLHLDVFSMRTLFVQNVIFENLFKSSVDTPLTIGNYFDNTSVYIGKYFGSAIYADALLHLSYYDPLSLKKDTVRKPVYGNLLFQPEIGLEMNTPFFLLRWHMAPSRPDTAFISDTGLTISWKFSY